MERIPIAMERIRVTCYKCGFIRLYAPYHSSLHWWHLCNPNETYAETYAEGYTYNLAHTPSTKEEQAEGEDTYE
jgi:hypothetical protein